MGSDHLPETGYAASPRRLGYPIPYTYGSWVVLVFHFEVDKDYTALGSIHFHFMRMAVNASYHFKAGQLILLYYRI